ncbi:MAG TPA: hypothetical protein DCZ92_10755 [Elusimicrobia bacterium]|nr:MAG: hypothetical protein A2016_04445 [Elusimicrobia bacterium GWF2_62_30]HBA61274.1 hypothetical protein [Elusimicrobiota bacterium]
MKKTAILFPVLLAAMAAGCKQKAPDQPPVPKTTDQVQDAATQVGVSTGGAIGTMLNAPGNYMKGMVGNVDKAKAAAAQYNKIAEDRMKMDPETGK